MRWRKQHESQSDESNNESNEQLYKPAKANEPHEQPAATATDAANATPKNVQPSTNDDDECSSHASQHFSLTTGATIRT